MRDRKEKKEGREEGRQTGELRYKDGEIQILEAKRMERDAEMPALPLGLPTPRSISVSLPVLCPSVPQSMMVLAARGGV